MREIEISDYGYLAANIDLAIRRTIQGLKRIGKDNSYIAKTVLGTVEAVNNIPELNETEVRSIFKEEDVIKCCEEFQSHYESLLQSDQCKMCTGCMNANCNH